MCSPTSKRFVKSVSTAEAPGTDPILPKSPGGDLLPIGVVVSLGLFFIGRKLLKKDRCREIVAKEVGEFLNEQQRCYDLIRCHQSGKPCNSSKSLKASREEISAGLKSLTNFRERISQQLSANTAKRWKGNHLEWKDAMQGDSGFISEKGSVCPLKLLEIEKAQQTYQKFLVALRQTISRGNEKVAQLSILS